MSTPAEGAICQTCADPINEDWLKRKKFGRFVDEDGKTVWQFGAIHLSWFDDHWRIKMADWWEYFPEQTTQAITTLGKVFGIDFNRKSLKP